MSLTPASGVWRTELTMAASLGMDIGTFSLADLGKVQSHGRRTWKGGSGEGEDAEVVLEPDPLLQMASFVVVGGLFLFSASVSPSVKGAASLWTQSIRVLLGSPRIAP